jgi:hypothetical protein
MQYGLYVQNVGEYGDPHNLIALALDDEQGGWDGFSSEIIFNFIDIQTFQSWTLGLH